MASLRTRILVTGLLLASIATGYLVSNSPVNGGFVYERIPSNRRPANLLVDTEPVTGVANPLAVAQDLMNQWNLIPEAEDVFGTASAGGPYNGTTVGDTFGTFTDTQFEIAFDDTGDILTNFGISASVLGITLKSVTTDNGNLLDFLVVVNTTPAALVAPGTGATAEQLFRSTLLHELGHATGLGHTPTGFVNTTTFGLTPAFVSQMPTMYAFRLPQSPQQGGTLEGDDAVGLTKIYPADTSGLGSISGTVRALSGAPVNEVAVRVVGPQGGSVSHIGTLTNEDGSDQGRFTVPYLPPGLYTVVMEAVNGRGSINATSLAGDTDALGGNPFVFATDEHWQVGDTYDATVDAPATLSMVEVRAGRDTGGIDFLLNALPLANGPVAGNLASGDSQLPDAAGGFHFVDYWVFQATSGDSVSIDVTTTGALTPQLRLLRPSDLAVAASDLPAGGTSGSLALSLGETGPWILAVSARATTGNLGGTGNYGLTLQGANGTLTPPQAVTPAALVRGPEDPAAQQFASPVCRMPMLQLRLTAPSHEELWVDGLTLRASGTGDDREDVMAVQLVHDRDGDGAPDGDPVLASGVYLLDDGTLALDNLDLVFDPGSVTDLLVVYDVTVTSVSSTAEAGLGRGWPWLLLLLLLVPLRRVRRGRGLAVLALLALALVPLACGGGGGGGCNGPFDPAGVAVTFQVTLDANGLDATTPTRGPAGPLPLPAAAIASSTLTVSN
jgi:hypothetical protein